MLECVKINKIYNTGDVETHVLKDVSFKIDKGEFIAITGPSGSGKSTIMHIIGALDTPTNGQYLLEGQDVSKLTDEELAEIRKNKIGFVFQAFNLLARSTVLRNVILPLVYAEVPGDKREEMAKKALLSAGLEENRWSHLTNQLSGGQMQRVAIARALVNNPSIILADEPTGNLDTKTGEIVLKTFRELNEREGHTIILITHEREVAAHANRIISIRDGVIVEDKKSHNAQ
ncbi:MAG: ABC transporter ATP-binding protein [Patescibacteria group bacterium]|jgi:putative ABC transport system ATP-binding protein